MAGNTVSFGLTLPPAKSLKNVFWQFYYWPSLLCKWVGTMAQCIYFFILSNATRTVRSLSYCLPLEFLSTFHLSSPAISLSPVSFSLSSFQSSWRLCPLPSCCYKANSNNTTMHHNTKHYRINNTTKQYNKTINVW